jgi:hypothetical protein
MFEITWTKFVLIMSIIFASVASAEIYTWEDADAVHFTDNPSSVPDKYGDVIFPENWEQIKNTSSKVRIEESQKNRTVDTRKNQSAVYRANPDQQRQAVVTIKQQHTSALAEPSRNVKDPFPSLATLIVVWLIIALFLIIIWVATIADTVRSKFITPSIRTAWMLLVIFIPLIGMIFYYILGLSQKCNSPGYSNKQHLESLTQSNKSNGKGFTI